MLLNGLRKNLVCKMTLLAQNEIQIDEIIYVCKQSDQQIFESKSYLDIYSPRIASCFTSDTLRDEIKVLYACSPGEFANEFEFMLACKAKRSNRNFYIFEVSKKPNTTKELMQIFDPSKHNLYNIVSGDKIPNDIGARRFKILLRYMAEGVFVFRVMNMRGVGDYITGTEEGRIYTKSKKPHSFQRGDDCVLNTSNVFMGMLIDYYRIHAGVQGVDAQISFMRSEQYRIAVYIHMRDVFNAFVRNNMPGKENTSEIYDGVELCKLVMDILMSLAEKYDSE